MSMDYIRRTYGVPAKRGAKVLLRDGREGVVTSATHHVHVRVADCKWPLVYHPHDLTWLDGALAQEKR